MHTTEDYLVIDAQGNPVISTNMKPSAETLVHASIYSSIPECQAVLHIHTVANNLISELYRSEGKVIFSDHEMLKALEIWDGGMQISIPIVNIYEQIPTLAAEVSKVLNSHVPGVLIHNHGIYVWGNSDFAAKRHLEAFEFLFDYHLKLAV
jgi:methylthioribulose-1-phosphate dehydratase